MFGIFVLMFASCIYCRGTSISSKLAPFRECYGHLHELRSLIPSAVILSLTVTATRETKEAILDVHGIHRTIHFGPSNEALVQESGFSLVKSRLCK